METFHLLPYDPSWDERWDRFVMKGSMNGTFLQTRRFLNYHPKGRFEDASLMVLDGQELVAVCPAAAQMVGRSAMLRSHPGSTFGGLVIAPTLLRAPRLVALMEQLDAYWLGQGFTAAELKLTSDLFSTHPTDVLQYALYHAGYTDELEIAAYVPVEGRSHEELVAAYSFNKRYDLKKCVKAGLIDRPLHTHDELSVFYSLLCQNLRKFDATPVHTLRELVDFHDVRLCDEARFLGVFTPEGEMVAGACLFWFCQARVLHTQYLATAPLKGCVPSTYLYDSVVRAGLNLGARCVSFGTSTHDRGRVLNTGLLQNKEGYGALHSLNRIYTKVYREE